jgi:Putative rhamnosyl transferase
MLHVIITRFSYRFRKDDLVDKLLNPARLDHRIDIFKQYCFPSIINQNIGNFYWILIVDPLLPVKYRQKLQELIDNHKKTSLNKGPRDIWLHNWDWDINKLENIDWILNYFDNKPKYLITTRLDDDDALSYDFIKMVQHNLKLDDTVPFKYFSYSIGWHFYTNRNVLKQSRNPMIALGLSLITDINKYPICVYLGNHTRIPRYLKTPDSHSKLFALYKRNGDLPTSIQQVQKRLCVVKMGEPMWLRTIHGFNLQPNLKQHNKRFNPQKPKVPIQYKIRHVLNDKFHLGL